MSNLNLTKVKRASRKASDAENRAVEARDESVAELRRLQAELNARPGAS